MRPSEYRLQATRSMPTDGRLKAPPEAGDYGAQDDFEHPIMLYSGHRNCNDTNAGRLFGGTSRLTTRTRWPIPGPWIFFRTVTTELRSKK